MRYAIRKVPFASFASFAVRLCCLIECWHHFFREQLHRAQHALLVEITEAEVAVEIRDAHRLVDALDLADAGLRRADDEVFLDELLERRLGLARHGDGVAVLHFLVVVAQGERHPHVPARVLGGVARIGLVLRHVARLLHADGRLARVLRLGERFLQHPAELREPGERDAEAAGQHVEAAPRRVIEGVGALRRHPDRRVRLLQRLREDRGLRNLENLALVGERLAFERLHQDVDRLVPALSARIELETEALELVALVAAAEPDVDASAGEQVERRDLLGDDQGMMYREHDHRRAHPQLRGLRGDVGRELQRARQVAISGEVMLGEPRVAEAERFGGLRLLEPVRIDLRRGAGGRRLQEQEDAGVHLMEWRMADDGWRKDNPAMQAWLRLYCQTLSPFAIRHPPWLSARLATMRTCLREWR